MRCELEAKGHESNLFATLTYNDRFLPADGSLNRDHLTKFFDRLRKRNGPFRYYACGEYGDELQRAHYHACLFGMAFDDMQFWKEERGNKYYVSAQLEEIWGMGQCMLTDFTFETAAYTARYCMKKRSGEQAQQYVRVDEETGELIRLLQPYSVMSNRKAIGQEWLTGKVGPGYEGFHNDIYTKDSLVMRGKRMKPPKYYDRVYDLINGERLKEVKKKREEEREETSVDELRAHALIARARGFKRSGR